MIQHYCNGCSHVLIDYDKRYCDNCLTQFNKDKHSRVDTDYYKFIQSEQWHKFSRMIRHEKPRCEMCVRQRQIGMRNLVNPSQEVHHIKKVRDYPELRFKRSNVMALCKKCHKKLTEKGL